jgi:hypothetical protein
MIKPKTVKELLSELRYWQQRKIINRRVYEGAWRKCREIILQICAVKRTRKPRP